MRGGCRTFLVNPWLAYMDCMGREGDEMGEGMGEGCSSKLFFESTSPSTSSSSTSSVTLLLLGSFDGWLSDLASPSAPPTPSLSAAPFVFLSTALLPPLSALPDSCVNLFQWLWFHIMNYYAIERTMKTLQHYQQVPLVTEPQYHKNFHFTS